MEGSSSLMMEPIGHCDNSDMRNVIDLRKGVPHLARTTTDNQETFHDSASFNPRLSCTWSACGNSLPINYGSHRALYH